MTGRHTFLSKLPSLTGLKTPCHTSSAAMCNGLYIYRMSKGWDPQKPGGLHLEPW